MPLDGPVVEITVDPVACDRVADFAVAQLIAYNADTPGPQAATPSPTTCGRCSASCQCPEFWAAYKPEWAPQLLALKGEIESLSVTPLGGTAMAIRVQAGVGSPVAHLRGLDESQYRDLAGVTVGDNVAAVGLLTEPDHSSFRLPADRRLAKVG